MTVAAPAGTPGAGASVALPAAAMTVAAPAGVPGIAVTLPTAAMAVAAPAGSLSAGASVALPAAAMALAAPPGTPAAGSAVITVTVAGSASFAFPLTAAGIPDPGTLSLPVPVTNFAGDWLFAVISWHQAPGTPAVTWSVGDDAQSAGGTQGHNWWDPLGTPTGTSSASGVTRTAIWVAPAARECSNVYIAPTGFALSVACTVLDVAGLLPWYTLADAVAHTHANAGTALPALTQGAPASQSFFLTACSSDENADTISLAGTGWTSGSQVQASNGTDHTSDITQNLAWQTASGSVSATWSSNSAQDLSGVIGGVLAAAQMPGQPSRYWPVTIAEMAPGSGIGSAPDTLSWTPTTARYLKMDVTQGRQYELAQLSTGEGTLLLDNPDGALLPPGTGSFAGITSGTPYRLRTAWPGGAWQVSFHGDGSTSGPKISTGNVYNASAGSTYSSSAWLSCSPYYAAGCHMTMNFRTSGGSVISSVMSSSVTGLLAELVTVAGTAPAGTALIDLTFGAAGTPPATTTFYAAAAPY
jgi:hypothetical protein